METESVDPAEWRRGLGYEELPVSSSGKRCGVQWTPWMGDWFTSWSPRNDNNNAEGPWEHWVGLALQILADPMTQIVRPDEYRPNPKLGDFCTEHLDDEQLRARFRDTKAD